MAASILQAVNSDGDFGDEDRLQDDHLHGYPQPDPIIRRVHQVLLRAKVPFGGLDRSMAKEQLNLLQFAAGGPAHFRT